jgi:phosphatidylserine/phosphatidylglycerophosphate/cardiolipin synthase-like enzyme
MLRAMRSLPRSSPAALALGLTVLTLACGGSKSTTEGVHDAGVKHDAPVGSPDAPVDASPDVALDAPPDVAAPVDAAVPPPTLITEPDQGMTPIYALFMSAKTSIDMTMYELEDSMTVSVLTAAAKNGVKVRVILDTNLEMSSNAGDYAALNAGGCEAHWANPTYAATHQKTITIDGKTSAIMTINLASYYYPSSRDFALVTSDPTDVAAIEATFEADFASTAITPNNGTNLVWSPTNSQAALVGLISGAKSSLLIENEEMSDQAIVDAIVAAAQRGVDVEVAMVASNEWDGAFTSIASVGGKVATYSRNASLYIHAKVILADYGQPNASVFIGSENFSNASLTENRELGIILSDPAVMASINTTLSKDFAGGTPYN